MIGRNIDKYIIIDDVWSYLIYYSVDLDVFHCSFKRWVQPSAGCFSDQQISQ